MTLFYFGLVYQCARDQVNASQMHISLTYALTALHRVRWMWYTTKTYFKGLLICFRFNRSTCIYQLYAWIFSYHRGAVKCWCSETFDASPICFNPWLLIDLNERAFYNLTDIITMYSTEFDFSIVKTVLIINIEILFQPI